MLFLIRREHVCPVQAHRPVIICGLVLVWTLFDVYIFYTFHWAIETRWKEQWNRQWAEEERAQAGVISSFVLSCRETSCNKEDKTS